MTNHAVVLLRAAGTGGPGVVVTPPDDDLAEACRIAGADLARSGVRRLTLVLGSGLVQVRRIAGMPPVSRPRLRAIVGGDPGRYVRVMQSAVTFDATWLPNDTPPVALVVAAPTEKLDAAVEGFGLAGIRVDRIGVEGHEGADVDLLPARARSEQRGREWRATGGLGLMAALVWLGLAGRSIGQLRAEERALLSRQAEIASAAGAVAGARFKVDEMAVTIRVLDSVRGRRGRMLLGLADAASGLPDRAFLTSLAADRDTVRLAGLAPSPARLMERAATRRSLTDPRLLPPAAGRAGSATPGLASFEIVAGRGAVP